MGTGSFELHEEGLPADVIDRHRAIVSIMEELEAVDWYDQRVAVCDDPELAGVLAHNRDEEKEHFAMTLGVAAPSRPQDRRGPAHLPLHRGRHPRRSSTRPRRKPPERGGASGAGSSSLGIGSLRNESEGEL